MRDKDWEIIQVLYEKKSITQAAEALFITQSALTKRLSAIEDELGTEIVKRSSQGIIFTENGKYLFQKAIAHQKFMEEVRAYLSESKKTRELLRIGVPNSFARLHMARLLKKYRDQYDQLQIQTLSYSSDIILQHLTNGTVDMGIICGDYPFPGHRSQLLDEGLFIAAPQSMQPEELPVFPLIETYYNPVVKQLIDQWWKQQFGNVPRPSQRVPYPDIALEMVESGLGICFLFGTSWRIDETKIQKIPAFDRQGNPISRRVWLMWPENHYQSEEFTELIEFIQTYFRISCP